MYKSKLQELCQWLKWGLPEYEMKREGTDHNPRFQATIVIDGITYQSRDNCRSMKQAQNEVAHVALRHLSPSIGSASSKSVSVNNLRQPHLEEGAGGVQVPEISVPVPVVQEHSRTEDTSHAISAQTNSITTQQRFKQEVAQVPEFTISNPIVKDDNKAKGAFLASNVLKSIITSQQINNEISEVGGIHESNVSTSIVIDGNTSKVFSNVINESTNNTSSRHILQEQRRELGPVLESSVPLLSVYSTNKMKDMNHLCKSQLQTYTQKQNLFLPTYIPEREGPPHACRFRCKVIVGEQTFESREFFPTLREAENAVAKIALVALTPNASQEGDCLVYKNLLQELAQKKTLLLPVYTTARTGPPHSPTFVSTVEVAGNVFSGQEAKTKKLAEMSAAKVAYMSLSGGIPSETPSPPLPSERQEKPHEPCPTTSSVSSSLLQSPPIRPRKITPDVPLQWVEVHEEELLLPDVARELAKASFEAEKKLDTSPTLENHTGNDTTVSSVGEINNKLIMGTGSRSPPPLGERVVVHSWTPGMTLPEGSELLFRDDKWVAFRHPKPQTLTNTVE